MMKKYVVFILALFGTAKNDIQINATEMLSIQPLKNSSVTIG